MIDLDHLAESNVNRQIHALTDTLGQAKVTALAQRIVQINPYCEVTEIEDFVDADNLDEMIGSRGYDYVIDAIDNVRAKTALIAYCRAHAIKLVTIGGAGGQVDPTKIEVRDLCRTEQEPLLAKVRKLLRQQHRFPRGIKNKFGIDAVFSTEPLRFPEADEACEINEATELGDNAERKGVTGLNCAGFGSAMVVTAAFGLVAASWVLNKLAADAMQADATPSDPAQVAA
jgi:tRNA A37 threonylcarbamoyladenosine dehydratase